jgi:hypothetical protein
MSATRMNVVDRTVENVQVVNNKLGRSGQH